VSLVAGKTAYKDKKSTEIKPQNSSKNNRSAAQHRAAANKEFFRSL
jgi:hypothetical protein